MYILLGSFFYYEEFNFYRPYAMIYFTYRFCLVGVRFIHHDPPVEDELSIPPKLPAAKKTTIYRLRRLLFIKIVQRILLEISVTLRMVIPITWFLFYLK